VPAHVCSQSQLAYALFTSGTTGEPRLCFHAHADSLVYDHTFGKAALALRPGDVTLSVSKTHFAYGLGNSVFYPLLSGATAILEPAAPTADGVLASVTRFGVDVLFAVPSFYARLLAHPEAEALSSVAIAVCAGEVLPRSVEERVDALDGPILLNGIGSTEMGQTFASNVPGSRRFGTVGRALPPYRIRVVDGAGDDLAPGCEGRLIVRGTTLAFPCASAHEYRAAPTGLWYPTGDLAALDDDGYLRIPGRLDDVEIVGGINVHPSEIEDLFSRHAMVRDVAVCATRDSRGVSRLVAYVVPADDSGDRRTLEADLLASARGRMAPYKIPRGIVFVPELPRTFTGKLRRRALREAAARYEKTNSWQVYVNRAPR
jgi:acyl-coenzyme A synthetase/AMP-(fatty) acid ligase